MKRIEIHGNQNFLFHNLLYIDKDTDPEIQITKVNNILETFYGEWYRKYNCSYSCESMPIKDIFVDGEIKKLHHIIINVNIPDGMFRSFRSNISYGQTNLSRGLAEHQAEWQIEWVYITDFCCNSRHTRMGSIGPTQFEEVIKRLPIKDTPSINMYVKGSAGSNMRRAFATGNFYNCNLDIEIYDNIDEGLRHRPVEWFATYSAYPYHQYYQREYNLSGARIYGKLIKDTIIFADYNFEKDEMLNTLLKCDNMFAYNDFIFLNKYHLNFNRFVSIVSDAFLNYTSLTLMLVNQDKLSNIVLNNNITRTNNPSGTIVANYTTPAIRQLYMNWGYQNTKLTNNISLAVPYKINETKHIQTLEFINDMFKYTKLTSDEDLEQISSLFRLYYNHYLKDKPLMQEKTSNDILVEWFEMCSSTAYNEQEQLKKAYINLKENLENEYKEAEIYLKEYDLSKKKAIPAIQLSEDLTHRVEKQLSFDFDKKTYTKLNNMSLTTPIVCENVVVRTITTPPRSNRAMYIMNNLDKFFNNKTNTIRIDIDTIMKGKGN